MENPKSSVLMISSTQRQAEEIFLKAITYCSDKYPDQIKKGKHKATKSKFTLKNNSVIRCLPTGLAGLGIKGFTINLLIEDESALIDDAVMLSVRPMLLTTNGLHWKLSTPFGTKGHFKQAWDDPDYKRFFITSEECAEQRAEPYRTAMLKFLEKEKKRMTALQYAQEYLAQFVADLSQYFSDELIRSSTILKKRETIRPQNDYYLGVDVGGMGTAETTYEVIDKISDTIMEQVENQLSTKTQTYEVVDHICHLNRMYDFQKIFIDDGGIGFGVWSYLSKMDDTKRKTFAINNSARSVERNTERRKRILKEELYENMKMLLEQGHLRLLDDDEVRASLKSIQVEYVREEGKKTVIKIYGNYSHICEGLIRAAWCSQEKNYKFWIR